MLTKSYIICIYTTKYNPDKAIRFDDRTKYQRFFFFSETFYFFGDNNIEEWESFFENYKLPPFNLPLHYPALSFGLAGPGTGVPFHFHGPGFAETIYGRKRWFLTPPDVKPEFHPNKTTLQWFFDDYPKIKEDVYIYECTLKPGEVIHIGNLLIKNVLFLS